MKEYQEKFCVLIDLEKNEYKDHLQKMCIECVSISWFNRTRIGIFETNDDYGMPHTGYSHDLFLSTYMLSLVDLRVGTRVW